MLADESLTHKTSSVESKMDAQERRLMRRWKREGAAMLVFSTLLHGYRNTRNSLGHINRSFERLGTSRTVNRLRSVARLMFRRRSEEHTSELQSRGHLVCRLLLEKKK